MIPSSKLSRFVANVKTVKRKREDMVTDDPRASSASLPAC
jgi:putative heme iron utilization protein